MSIINNIGLWDDNNIKGFFGEYSWLSNFHLCQVIYQNREFPSSEHAYIYGKLGAIYGNIKDLLYKELISLSPKEAKKWGARIILPEDWPQIRLSVMREVLKSKFKNELAQKLKATGDKYLEETNWWKDTFWGVDHIFGGQNHLGRILMDIRSSLQNAI